MTLDDVLKEILDHLPVTDHVAVIGWDIVQQWPVDTIARLKQAGILKTAPSAQSITCNACEKHCFMDVFTLTSHDVASIRAFIVCDDAEMQSQIGRVRIPLERLQQWQASHRQLAGVVAGLLGIESKPIYQKESANYKLGMLKSSRGRRWVCLTAQSLVLEINRHAISLNDLLYFDGDELVIDELRIDELLNSVPSDTDKTYAPNVSKREARKLATQAMYQDWHDEYLKLKRKHPRKTDRWYSMQIAKLSLAQGKDSETIRKNMKK